MTSNLKEAVEMAREATGEGPSIGSLIAWRNGLGLGPT